MMKSIKYILGSAVILSGAWLAVKVFSWRMFDLDFALLREASLIEVMFLVSGVIMVVFLQIILPAIIVFLGIKMFKMEIDTEARSLSKYRIIYPWGITLVIVLSPLIAGFLNLKTDPLAIIISYVAMPILALTATLSSESRAKRITTIMFFLAIYFSLPLLGL